MSEESTVRRGSSDDFCPPTEEGITIKLQDDNGDTVDLEFLGFILDGDHTFGFFFPLDDDNKPLDSGEVLALEVVGTDEEGQPSDFELIEDEDLALDVYEKFKRATKDLYVFE